MMGTPLHQPTYLLGLAAAGNLATGYWLHRARARARGHSCCLWEWARVHLLCSRPGSRHPPSPRLITLQYGYLSVYAAVAAAAAFPNRHVDPEYPDTQLTAPSTDASCFRASCYTHGTHPANTFRLREHAEMQRIDMAMPVATVLKSQQALDRRGPRRTVTVTVYVSRGCNLCLRLREPSSTFYTSSVFSEPRIEHARACV
ncbi:uncharacterized protein BDV14DRAFT_97914 [Aspergillus stella-maris]|uniref:uncharacterized protein n=1 Tax=Aspergillus stella-maris TaxID=1810926 RepID=UPI003CCDD409